MDIMRGVCEKYGQILNSYMRKNTNGQTRSYFLFTYPDVKTAMRAKIQLNKRRDLLGDKRVEVTLLIDEEVIVRGKDLSYTAKMFQGQGQSNSHNNNDDKKRNSIEKQYGGYQQQPQYGGGKDMNPPQYGGGGMYNQPPPQGFGGYMLPTGPYGQPPGMYYSQQNTNNSSSNLPPFYNQLPPKGPQDTGSVHDILQSVLNKCPEEKRLPPPPNSNNEKIPVKTNSYKEDDDNNNVTDIVGKLLGNESAKQHDHEHYDKDKDRQPSWSGFLTWKGLKRVGVDGHTQFKEPEDYVINIMNVIDPCDVITKQNSTMVLQPTNSISESTFREYVKALKGKTGVSFTSHSLIYVMGKGPETDKIQKIGQNELLVVMEKPSLSSLIKNKLQKIQELK